MHAVPVILLALVSLWQPQPQPEKYPAFIDAEIRIMEDFYRPGSGNVLPALARKPVELPPGVAKQLHRGGTLPSGTEKKLAPLPKDLDRRLTPVPAGYHRYLAGTHALLVQDATNLIVDAADLHRRPTP